MERYTKGIIRQYEPTYELKRGIKYSDLIVCFDIEVSSAWVTPDGDMINYDKELSKQYYSKCTPIALCYLWQCAIENDTYYGRDICEFNEFLDELANKYSGIITIWVHNLSYEFQFLLNILEFEKMFARAPHKVIYADYYRFRFRCSYFLKHMSLRDWGKSLLFDSEEKVEGYDYNIIRTPLTDLSDFELYYGEKDVRVMVAGIREELIAYSHIASIPLTQTGKIRLKIKEMFKKDVAHHKLCTELLPQDSAEYSLLKLIFAGGYTHANYMHSNRLIKDVKSKDRSSSYPALMCTKKYPMSQWQEISPDDVELYGYPDYSIIMDITFYDIKSTTYNTYISSSKCYELEDNINDNGRISSAKRLSMCMTNIDYDIIKQCYKWDIKNTTINRAWISINDYLPECFVRLIMDLYKNKTTLKDVIGKEMLYTTSKESFNAMFGMMCTAIIQENVSFNGLEWHVDKLKPETIDEELDKLKHKPHKNYLAYQWGVWITAYARQALWRAIIDLDYDTVYNDTDSDKYIGNHDDIFNKINNELLDEIYTVCRDRGFTIDNFTAVDSKGNVHIMGLWEDDGIYTEFKTLGAKRYVYRDSKDGQLHMTVSGVSKTEGVKSLSDDINNFTNELVIDSEYSKRLVFTYIYDMPEVVWNKGKYDEYKSSYRYGINALPSAYTVDMGDYMDTLEIADYIIENLDFDAETLHDIMDGVKKNEKTKILQNHKHRTEKRRLQRTAGRTK